MLCGSRRVPDSPQMRRVLHNIPEAAGSLYPRGPRRAEPEGQARAPAAASQLRRLFAEAADDMRLRLRRRTHRPPDVRALHHMPEPAGSLCAICAHTSPDT